jgi:hypothetical protein
MSSLPHRADVQHLGHVALRERFHPERRRDLGLDLRPPRGELLLDLTLGGPLGQDDHERPAPRRSVSGEDLVEVGPALGVPPKALERTDLARHAPPLEGEAQPVCDPVEAGQPRFERLAAGRAGSIDHHEAVLGDREQTHSVAADAVLVVAVLRVFDHLLLPHNTIGSRTASLA